MKILGYVLLVAGLFLGGTTVNLFSTGKYRQKSSWNKYNWYWKLLVFIIAVAICIVGVLLIS
jgi:hypothetical protein